MDRVASLLLIAMCGAMSSCIGGGDGGHARCGRSYVTPVYWGASAGAVGGWYGGGALYDGYYGSGWYDPGDDYDPVTDSGGISAEPDSNDGSGWDQPDDGSGDPGSDTSDTSGDTSGDSAGDSSGEALTRLHLHDVTASPLPPASASPSSSPSPSSPASPSTSPSTSTPLAEGCFACTMGCRTDAAARGSGASGRQAVGVSDTSVDDACGSAVRTLAQWSHDRSRARLVSCQRIDGSNAPNPPTSTRQ